MYTICVNIIFSILLMLVPGAYAYDAEVQRVGAGQSIEQLINSAESHAEAELKGPGRAIELRYSALSPLTVIVLYPDRSGGFAPLESIHTKLNAGSNQVATIDLTSSPNWSPWRRAYRLHFLSESGDVEFHDVTFIKPSIVEVIMLSVKQLFLTHPYTPSSYHRLPAYRISGMSFTVLLGLMLIGISSILLVKKQFEMIIAAAVIFTLLSHARFSLDALRYTFTHTASDYATAGSLIEVAHELKKQKANSYFLCDKGTSYFDRLLAYHSYPVQSSDAPSHLIVRNAGSSIEQAITCDG